VSLRSAGDSVSREDSDFAATVYLPKVDSVVGRTAGEALAVGTEGHAQSTDPLSGEGSEEFSAAIHVPEAESVVGGTTSEALAVGAEYHAYNADSVSGEGSDLSSAVHLPEWGDLSGPQSLGSPRLPAG